MAPWYPVYFTFAKFPPFFTFFSHFQMKHASLWPESIYSVVILSSLSFLLSGEYLHHHILFLWFFIYPGKIWRRSNPRWIGAQVNARARVVVRVVPGWGSGPQWKWCRIKRRDQLVMGWDPKVQVRHKVRFQCCQGVFDYKVLQPHQRSSSVIRIYCNEMWPQSVNDYCGSWIWHEFGSFAPPQVIINWSSSTSLWSGREELFFSPSHNISDFVYKKPDSRWKFLQNGFFPDMEPANAICCCSRFQISSGSWPDQDFGFFWVVAFGIFYVVFSVKTNDFLKFCAFGICICLSFLHISFCHRPLHAPA